MTRWVSSLTDPRKVEPSSSETDELAFALHQLRYGEVLLSAIFKSGGDAVLRALEQAELISILSVNGRPHSIRPGRPVYTSAFRLLVQDRALASRLDLSTLTDLATNENRTVEKCEAELALLASLPGKGTGGVRDRVLWLMHKLRDSQLKIEAYEAESSMLKKILRTEY